MRVTYATDDSVKYVGHLDMARSWERALRRARFPLAYTQGFNPQPRIQFAAALPVGFTGQAEVVDVFLDETLTPQVFLAGLSAALPPGIRAIAAEAVSRELPSLQSQIRGASYSVSVETDEADPVFEERMAAFLAQSQVWHERSRGKKKRPKRYDLRALVQALGYAGRDSYGQAFEVEMLVQPGAAGRPDDLLDVLGFGHTPRRIVRLGLAFADGADAPQTEGKGGAPA